MTAERKKPELLAPAGDWEKLQMAVLYGADAVYLAGTSFGMRSFAGNFSDEELPRAVDFAHRHGVKVHATVNTMPRSGEVDRLPEHLEKLNDAGVDALILADLGAFTLAGKYAPRCQRHISTQQSIANYACAQAWFDLGAQRVVLARELGMDEIREIRRRVDPALELETFCHGAMCVSYSGRCLLSNYMTGRDSNRGACAQPCRYQYALMEEKRPGEYFPVFEDEKGTYIMNSRDMCMIDHLDDLMDAGVDCLKIEGRAKSAYYAAIVTGAYRHVLDDVAAGRPGLADLRRGDGLHAGGPGHPEPAQQVCLRGSGGGGGAGHQALYHDSPHDDRQPGAAADGAENAADGVYHAAAPSGAAYELCPPRGGPGRKINVLKRESDLPDSRF